MRTAELLAEYRHDAAVFSAVCIGALIHDLEHDWPDHWCGAPYEFHRQLVSSLHTWAAAKQCGFGWHHASRNAFPSRFATELLFPPSTASTYGQLARAALAESLLEWELVLVSHVDAQLRAVESP